MRSCLIVWYLLIYPHITGIQRVMGSECHTGCWRHEKDYRQNSGTEHPVVMQNGSDTTPFVFLLSVECSTPCLHANPAAAVTRVHDVSVLTRSHLSRCIRPVKGLRCGLRRRPCALRSSRVFVAARRNRVPHIREECVYVPLYPG